MDAADIARIKEIPLFRDLSDELIISVAEVGTSRSFAAGEPILRHGDAGDELYVVRAGRVRIHKDDVDFRVLGPGEFFGEISVIDGSARSADVTALDAAELFSVRREDYLSLLMRHKALLERLLSRLTRDVRDGNAHRFGLVREQSTLREESELERLRSLSQMVAGLAHEINTPLGIIQNAASFVVDSLDSLTADVVAKDPALEDVADACRLVQKNASVAARLVQTFKSLSVRQITEARETTDIVATVSEALELYRLKARSSNLRLVTHSDLIASERSWDGYPGHLVQIILNLVENAQRYAYPDVRGGTVEVFVSTCERDPGKGGRSFQITVRDFGAGIPEKHVRDVFLPFFTTGRARGGTGLGLAIVHNLVTAALGGTVRVESTEGKGTAFIVCMPISAPAPATRGANG
jgi:signal transduction histidine kinase